MPKLSRDGGIPTNGAATLNPRETIFAAAALAVANAEQIIPADGCSTVSLLVSGTYTGQLTVEGSVDGTNWDSIPVKPINGGGARLITLASAAVGRWSGNCSNFRVVRVRATALSAGAANVVIVAENGVSEVYANQKASDLSVTNTGAAAAAVTLTLPAPGVGLYQFITRLIIQRIASAVLTAAAAPILVTTTNLPGTRVFSFPADAAALGVIAQEVVEPPAPMRASAANTAVTIVCPITTGVIWRVTADYYIDVQ